MTREQPGLSSDEAFAVLCELHSTRASESPTRSFGSKSMPGDAQVNKVTSIKAAEIAAAGIQNVVTVAAYCD
jgi:hypothetical protein